MLFPHARSSALLLLLAWGTHAAQAQHGSANRHAQGVGTSAAAKHSAAEDTSDTRGRVDMLSRLEAAAVQSGDAAQIASASRELNAELLDLLGRIADSDHRTTEAVALYSSSVTLHPATSVALRLAGALTRAGRPDEAIRFAQRATEAEPQNPRATMTLAAALHAAHRDGSAATLSAAEKAQLNPPAVSPQLRAMEAQLRTMLHNGYNDLGTAEARQQEYVQALHDFQQAEQFGDASPALLHNIAIAAYRANDPPEVIRALTEYFGTTPAPQDPRSRLMLAMANFDGGHFGEAAHNFQAAGDAALADPRTTYSYALSLARIGDAQQANALADRLVASANLPPDKLALVCNVYFTAENYESSQGCYTRVTQQDPALPRAHYFVAESLIHLDRPAEAIPPLRAELLLTPNEPNVQSSLAFALAQTGHKDEAQPMLERTVAAHPEHAESQYQLGKLLAEQGKTAEAIPHLQASVQHDSSKDYAHYQLATALRKAGRTTEAEHEFAVYREIKDQHRNDRAAPKGAQPDRPTP